MKNNKMLKNIISFILMLCAVMSMVACNNKQPSTKPIEEKIFSAQVGYEWERVGEFTLKQGENVIKIHDKT